MVVGLEPLSSQSPAPSFALVCDDATIGKCVYPEEESLQKAHPLMSGSGSAGPKIASYVLTRSGDPMTKLILVLLACTACASAPVTTVSTAAPVASVSGPTLTGASMWADSAGRLIETATIAGNLQGLRSAGLLIDRALAAYPNDALLLQYPGYGPYREAGLLGGGSPSEKADLPLVAATARVKLLGSLPAQPFA